MSENGPGIRRPAGGGLVLAAVLLFAGCGGSERGVEAKADGPGPLPVPHVWSSFLTPMFEDPLYGGPLLHDKVDSLPQIRDHLDRMLVPADLFFEAYPRMEITGAVYDSSMGVTWGIVAVDYDIGDSALRAHAYFKPMEGGTTRYAALVIPPTGHNESTPLLAANAIKNVHSIPAAVAWLCDLYIYVKPNEDFLAIHNGQNKLGYDYVTGYLINKGGSYSTLYLVHTLAVVKHLKAKYDKVIVLGISQGGKATLLNALQSEPDGAVVSSGYSVVEDIVYGAGPGQILIPGLDAHYGPEQVHELIRESSTRFLFTYGRQEEGLYGLEANRSCTRDYFKDLENVECRVHFAGHKFPVGHIREFVQSVLGEEETPFETR